MPGTPKIIDVVCGVLQRPDGAVLLAQRPANKIWAGYWEFPGGKIEAGESPADAIERELREELGIATGEIAPWLERSFDYPHGRVRLRFMRVLNWTGEPQGCEGQSLTWCQPPNVGVAPLLPANAPILKALALPPIIAITPPHETPLDLALRKVAAGLQRHGWRWLQVRRCDAHGDLSEQEWQQWSALGARYGCRVSLNASLSVTRRLGAQAWHANSANLAQLRERPAGMVCVGASVHDSAAIDRVSRLGLDYAVLGAVHATTSHPGQTGLGWDGWSDIIGHTTVPVFAIGGLNTSDLETATRRGAHGLAMIRGAWEAG